MKKSKISFDIFENEDGSIDIKPTIKGELTYGVSVAIIVMFIRSLRLLDTMPRIIWAVVKEYVGGNKK